MALSKQEIAKLSIRASLTESAANTFTELAVQTNLAATGEMLFVATGLWMFLNGTVVAAADLAEMQMTYSTQSAIILPGDPDWFAGRSIHAMGIAVNTYERVTYVDINNFPIATPTIYLGVQGTSQGGSLNCAFKLEGYLQKVNVTDFFRIANLR